MGHTLKDAKIFFEVRNGYTHVRANNISLSYVSGDPDISKKIDILFSLCTTQLGKNLNVIKWT